MTAPPPPAARNASRSIAKPRARSILICLLVLTVAATASSQTPPKPPEPQPQPGATSPPAAPVLNKLVPEAAERGATVRIEAERIPDGVTRATVALVPLWSGDAAAACAAAGQDVVRADAAVSSSGVTFTVPYAAPLGRYYACVSLPNVERPLLPPPSSAPFRVLAPAVNIAGITPKAVYPDRDRFAFWVDGTGFSPVESENVLLIDGHATQATMRFAAAREMPRSPGAPAPAPAPASLGDRMKAAEPRQLLVDGVRLDDKVRGVRRVRLRVGNQESNELEVLFSASKRGYPRALAFVTLLALAALILALVAAGLRALGSKRPKLLAALLLENGMYSLGRLQFYAWTAAAVLGYAFLAFSRSLLQGKPELPDAPWGLPAIIGISAGTGVLAAAMSGKGPAGPEPSIADFIMSGGTVVAERVQFLVWTFVSILAFLVLVATYDPATIETLPRIPEGLLWLMGLSAGGYLGGKFVRSPSPLITSVVPKDDNATKKIALTIQGRYLSKNASLAIDDVPLPEGTEQSGGLYREAFSASVPEPGSATDYFQQLVTTVHYNDPPLKPGEHILLVTNPDGKAAKGKIDVKTDGKKGPDVKPMIDGKMESKTGPDAVMEPWVRAFTTL